MAEVFGTVAAAIALAGTVKSIVDYLKQVKNGMATVEDEIEDLIREIGCLEQLYNDLGHQCDQQLGSDAYNAKQDQLWSRVSGILQKGRKFVNDLDVEVKTIYKRDPKTLGRLDAFKKQQRMSSGSEKRTGLSWKVFRYNQVLSFYLGMINASTQYDNSASLRDLQTQIGDLINQNQHRDQVHSDTVWIAAIDELRQSCESLQLSRQDKKTHFYIPQPVDSNYVGREEEAENLKTWFFADQRGQPRAQKRFVIQGVGGSGKTQFSCKFAQDHRHRFWGVFHIDGRSHEQLQQSLSVNVASHGDVASNYRAALDWLANQDDPWLLIIDNADDPSIELGDYFPAGSRGYVLITTRNPSYRHLGNVDQGYFYFQGLRHEEASKLLFKTANLTSTLDEITHAATTIIEALGYLALAINVAGSAIREGCCRIQGYLKYLEDERKERRRKKAGRSRADERHDESFEEIRQSRVEATFDISYNNIAKQGSRASRDALQLLKMFAFLHCEDIRYSFLQLCCENKKKEEEAQLAEEEAAANLNAHAPPKSWSATVKDILLKIMTALHGSPAIVLPDVLRQGRERGYLDETRVRKAMKELTQYSLATYNAENDSWSMHPLIHAWASEKIEWEGQMGEQYVWCEAAANLLSNCVMLGPNDEALMRALLPHVDHVRKEHVKLEKRIHDNRISRMKPFPIFESGFSPQRALKSAKFSMIYAQNGRFMDAKELQTTVQNFTVNVYGFGNARTRRITRALADTLWHLGRGDESARLLEKLVEACTTYCGPKHRETFNAKQKLGESRWLQGRVREAKILIEEALEGLQSDYDPHVDEADEDILMAMDSLATALTLFATDESLAKAKWLHQTTFNARTRCYGEYDLRTLHSRELLCSLATWTHIQEDLIAAETGMQDILKIRIEKLGREHHETLLAMLNLARVHVELGHYEAADALFASGIPVAERNHGEDHVAVLFCRFHLGRLRARQGRWAEARDILIDVTERQTKALQGWGRYHYDRLGGLLELVRVHHELQEHDQCDAVVAEALHTFEKITTVEHPWARKLRDDAASWRSQRSVQDPSPALSTEQVPDVLPPAAAT